MLIYIYVMKITPGFAHILSSVSSSGSVCLCSLSLTTLSTSVSVPALALVPKIDTSTTSVVTKYEIDHILLDMVLRTYLYTSSDVLTAVHIPYLWYQHVYGTIQVLLLCCVLYINSATATAAVQLTHTGIPEVEYLLYRCCGGQRS